MQSVIGETFCVRDSPAASNIYHKLLMIMSHCVADVSHIGKPKKAKKDTEHRQSADVLCV